MISKVREHLNKEEGWSNLVENAKNTKAWENSNVAYVVKNENGKVMGYIRGYTDTCVSLFICEMLATSASRTFYESLGYRTFYGFLKSHKE